MNNTKFEAAMELLEKYGVAEAFRYVAGLGVATGGMLYMLSGLFATIALVTTLTPIAPTALTMVFGLVSATFGILWLLNGALWVDSDSLDVSPPPFGIPRILAYTKSVLTG
jgi:hypothetical protein